MAITVTVDATGISAPSYDDVLTELKTLYRGIYGQDIYVEPDSQDGQFLAILAQALHDTNSQAVAVYNSFSPSTAQGNGLSHVVKINGINRKIATRSNVDLLIGGTAGTIISGGAVRDDNGNLWNLPDTVTIPSAGQLTVTAISATEGALRAPAGTINTIATPTRGWQTVTNLLAAVVGDPIETDSELRQRQTVSTALPSQTIADGIAGAIMALPGVELVRIYDNDGPSTDSNGIPGHAVCIVVEGGDSASIAQIISRKKTGGTGTFGDTAMEVMNDGEMPITIKFQRPVDVEISVVIDIIAFNGYTSVVGEQIQKAVSDFINNLKTGDDIFLKRLYVPAQLNGSEAFETFDITSIKISRDAATPANSNLTLAFYERPVCRTDLVYLEVDAG